MGRFDEATYVYFSRPEYFADLINAEDRRLAGNCRTQFRQLLNVMSARRDKKRLYGLLASDEYGNLDQATARIIAVMANVPEFLEREEEYKNAEGGYNMCQAMNALMIPEESRGKIRFLMHERQ